MRYAEGGFTLIEMIVVVVLMGILAAIAIPRVSAARERAYVAAMKSDLRNLAALQAGHYSTYDAYASSFPSADYNTTSGVAVVIDSATATGWGAHAAHPATPITCTISVGSSGQTAPVCAY